MAIELDWKLVFIQFIRLWGCANCNGMMSSHVGCSKMQGPDNCPTH
jgi:hypothetical protein